MSFLINGKWVVIDDKNEYCKHEGIIFKRQKNAETIPVDCPVCKIMLVTVEDIQSFKRVECCEKCELIHYYPNREKWKKGWRPNLPSKDIISN
jgi:hypothetical protein